MAKALAALLPLPMISLIASTSQGATMLLVQRLALVDTRLSGAEVIRTGAGVIARSTAAAPYCVWSIGSTGGSEPPIPACLSTIARDSPLPHPPRSFHSPLHPLSGPEDSPAQQKGHLATASRSSRNPPSTHRPSFMT